MGQFDGGWGSYGGAQPGYGPPPPPQQQQPGFGAPGAAMVPLQPMPLAAWACPWCGYRGAPMFRQKVSGPGIAVTVILAVVFLPLFWIGLLMTETVPQCPNCRR